MQICDENVDGLFASLLSLNTIPEQGSAECCRSGGSGRQGKGGERKKSKIS